MFYSESIDTCLSPPLKLQSEENSNNILFNKIEILNTQRHLLDKEKKGKFSFLKFEKNEVKNNEVHNKSASKVM